MKRIIQNITVLCLLLFAFNMQAQSAKQALTEAEIQSEVAKEIKMPAHNKNATEAERKAYIKACKETEVKMHQAKATRRAANKNAKKPN